MFVETGDFALGEALDFWFVVPAAGGGDTITLGRHESRERFCAERFIGDEEGLVRRACDDEVFAIVRGRET